MPSITPQDLWDLYSPQKRAVVDWFFHPWNPSDYRTDMTWPAIECVVFNGIDRGVKNWAKFGEILRVWFPSLRTLMFDQNYAGDSLQAFVAFMDDPWLAHIWIEDHQTEDDEDAVPEMTNRFGIVEPEDIRHVRVFHCYVTECVRMKAILGDEPDLESDWYATKFETWKTKRDMGNILDVFLCENGLTFSDLLNGNPNPRQFILIKGGDLRR